MLYNSQDLRGYRCTLYRPDEFGDTNLKTAVIDSKDMFLDEYGHRDLGGPYDPSKWASPFQYFVQRHESSYIPESIETLVLFKPFCSGLTEAEADLVDDAILAILANRSVYYRHCPKCDPEWLNYFPNLKAIYLGALEDAPVCTPDGRWTKEPRRRRWFQNSIRAGRRAGVDIHTRTTREQPLHLIEFPSPPDQAELKFLPDSVKDGLEGPREFDVYSGMWGPPGCGNCGGCDECLKRYDASVWEELDQAST